MIDLKQRAQRQHFVLAQQVDVTSNGPAHHHLLIVGDAEGAVVLGQSLIEPERNVTARVLNEQVRVLVKDDGKGFLVGPILWPAGE